MPVEANYATDVIIVLGATVDGVAQPFQVGSVRLAKLVSDALAAHLWSVF